MKTKYDAILIPGGGIRDDGSLPEWTERRLKKAMDIFTGEYLITLSAGTTHKPPILDDKKFPIYESIMAAKYLKNNGIPTKCILTENISLDTIGNAYFVRVIHTEPRKLKNLCVITSEFHMPRTKNIFEWIFKLTPLEFKYYLNFLNVSDEGIDAELLAIRIKKEKKALNQIIKTKKNIKNIYQFHKWLFSQHTAYAFGSKSAPINGKILNSY